MKPSGTVTVDGHDIVTDYRAARSLIGLVPQELTTDTFETVWATVSFSRGLFGKSDNPAYIEKVLTESLAVGPKDTKLMTLSGGMKRRVLIAKALSHEPTVCFSTSRRRASTSSCARTCGRWCGNCALPA